MKKMIIAVFVLIAAAATTKAENINVNFDGRASEVGSLAEAIAGIPVPGAEEDPIPWMEPGFPGGDDGLFPHPMTCMLYCQHGMNNDCSCIDPWWPYPWYEPATCQTIPHNNTWYELANCTPGMDWGQIIAGGRRQTKAVAAARMLQPELQKKLQDILLGYCDTYPEFAAAVLPMLKDGNAKITVHNGHVYVIHGEKVMRFGANVPESERAATSKKWGLGAWETAVSAGEAVYNAVNAWNEYSSWPPVPDSGTADDYHGPALTVDPHDPDLQSYPSRKNRK
jgi:hypothetical protein